MVTRDEFRAGLIAFGERALKVRDHLRNEEATKVALVLPFIALLGYDDRDPTEVAAEHAADFSEKYRNRVDYALLRNMEPIIAVECKSLGNGKKDDRGQLKAYFNACRTVKLGILTDGFLYEFFVDSEEPNLMDDEPFLAVNAEELAKAQISESVLDALHGLTKSHFDPDTIGDNARKSLTQRAFFEYLTSQFHDPSVEFTRFLLKENDIKHVRTQALDTYRTIAKSAIDDVVTANILRKLDIKDRQVASTAPSQPTTSPVLTPPPASNGHAETTAVELAAFETVRRRLAFLSAGDAMLFNRIDSIKYRDYQGKMAVFYELERKGRLLDILEGKDGSVRYIFFDDEKEPVTDLCAADTRLIALFPKKVEELSAK